MPARTGSREWSGAGAVFLGLIATACGDNHHVTVKARAFVGQLSSAECHRKMEEPEAPVSILCPGSMVTVCWSSTFVSSTTITVTPDPDGHSGTHSASGVMYLTPDRDTEVEVEAAAYAVTKKHIWVIDEWRVAVFDGRWDTACEMIGYRLDPAFVDDQVRALDVSARWQPMYRNHDGSIGDCMTPPFLFGTNMTEPFFFQVDRPFETKPFARPLKAIGDWGYDLIARCPGTLQCEPSAALPFNMTLQCRSAD